MDVSNSTDQDTGYRVIGPGGTVVLREGFLEPSAYDTIKVTKEGKLIVEFSPRDGRKVSSQVIENPKALVELVDEDGQTGVRLFVPTIDAFITYSIGEQKRARDLAEALRRHGVSTWLDTKRRRLPKMELMKVAQDARNFVVLLGPKMGIAEKQSDEWFVALDAVWRDASKRFIPLLFEGAKVPTFIRSASSEERPVVPLRIDDPTRDWDDAVASLVRILRSEEDPRKAGEPVGITEEDRRRQREWLAHIHGAEPSLVHAEYRDVDEQIEHLYDKLIALAQKRPAEDGALPDEEVERCYDRLLELQTAEAKRFREQFEASLAMPVDAGAQALAHLRALKEELEDLTSSDAATQDVDDTPAPAAR